MADARPHRVGRRPPAAWIGTVPFFGYVGVFLLLPTGIVVWNAITDVNGKLNFGQVSTLFKPEVRQFFFNSVELSAISALVGAVFGSVIAYAVASGNPDGLVRRLATAGSGLLAQFGGVILAFAFNATLGPTSGLLMKADWYYDFPQGIALIYVYFQIPLMVLVFLPAIDGMKTQWREATENLGGSSWQFWRHVGGPLLAPAFLGCLLLLFANSFSAYATVQAWENQIAYVAPQQINIAITSEVGLASANEAQILALGMIVVVVIVMTLYALLQRRTARWLR
jgi:putative spermidine/putrescine transport system permease protein